MLQPMVSHSASAGAGVIDSDRTDAARGRNADEQSQNTPFDRVMSDYRSSDVQAPAMKELAAGVQDASSKSGESSPLLPLSDSDSDSLDELAEGDSLITYLMANSGTEVVAVPSEININPALSGYLEADPEALLESSSLALTAEITEGGIETGLSDANGSMLLQQPGLTEVASSKSSETTLNQSKLAGELGESSQVLKNVSPSVDAAKQNLTTVQSTQALAEDAVIEQNQQALSQLNLKESAKQTDISQAQMLTQKGEEVDELIDSGLEKSLRVNDLQQGAGVQTKHQASADLQNIQQNEQINRPLRLANAASALSERIQTMISSNTQSATVRLDPPELGSMEIRVHVKNDQTHVQIITSSSQTREALEQQSARLREVLVDQGLNLSNLDVSDQQTQQRSGSGGSGSGQGSGGMASDVEQTGEPEQVVSTTLGYVDHYV